MVPDPVTPDPHRSSIRLSLPLWIGVAAAGLIVVTVGFYLVRSCVGPPVHRRNAAIPEVERLDEAPENEDLWRAAKKGQADLVEALLAKGLDPDAETEYGVTALHFAAARGHLDVVRVLLAHQASVNKKDRFYGASPLASAAAKQHWKVVAALLEAGAEGAAGILPGAAAAGEVEVVCVALETGTISAAALDRALAAAPQDQTELIELLETAGARRPDPAPAETRKYKLPLEAFVGTYRNESGFELGVALAGDRLSLTVDDRPIAVLVRSGEDAFTAADDVTTTFEFKREGEQIARFVRTHLDSPMTFERSQIPQVASRPVPADEDDSGEIVPQNWPSFRGPQATGVADGQKPPTSWDVEKGSNVRWKTPVAGLAHACPIVWDDRVYVATAVGIDGRSELKVGLYGDVDSAHDLTEHSWRTICLDRNSGDVVWDRIAHHGVPRTKRHTKGSHANCTPATDGAHVVVNFGSEGLYCYDRDGRLLWHRELGTLDSGWFFDEDYQWGFGSSPVIYRNLVIIQCDVGRGSYIAAFRLADGSEAWRTSRDEIPSWGSPTVVEGPERAELVTNATRFARGYDPLTGKELWRLARQSEITVPTPFYAEGLIFVASGYSPILPIYAIRPGASGDISLRKDETSNEFVSWSRPRAGPYLPTPIAYQGRLYVCANNGIVACYETPTGREIYKKRLPGPGAYTASPVAADGKVYFTNEQGQVTVLKAGAQFEVLAQNPLGEVCLSTPAISDGVMFFRTEGHVVAVGRPKIGTK
ncbi:MAG: PQQ-binding-like beta-propeller repeat protein [Deltaproteobacteria bacterium]